jgi:nucleoside-diphosphate-sugar epimerase
MKYFIVGATGFIGSHLVDDLYKKNHQITATFRKSPGLRIASVAEPFWLPRSLDQITVDDLIGHDVLIFLAAAGMPNNPEKVSFDEMFYYNLTCLIKILQAAKDAKIKKILLCSTFKEYGSSAAEYDFIPTTAPLLPTTPFSCSRVAGFYAAQAFAYQHSISIEYIRFFNVYGEGENELDLWTALRNAAILGQDFDMTPAEQIRDYIDVKDVVIQLGRIVDLPISNTLKVHHIASGQPIMLKDFADYWWKHWDAKGKIIYGALPYRTYESMRIVAKI